MSSQVQGVRLWLLQRLSAFYMAIYIIVAFTWFSVNEPIGFQAWQALFANPLVNIFSQLFIYLLLVHAWIGVRDIFIDYIHHTATRFILLLIASLLQLVLGLWVFMVFYSVVQT